MHNCSCGCERLMAFLSCENHFIPVWCEFAVSCTWAHVNVYFKPNIPCHQMSLRQRNVYIVPKARTDRLKKSAVAQAIELANRPTLVH